MTNKTLEQIALEVAGEMYDNTTTTLSLQAGAVEFLRRCLAKLGEVKVEPVAWEYRTYTPESDTVNYHFTENFDDTKRHDQYPMGLYTSDQVAAAVAKSEQRIAELEAENERLKADHEAACIIIADMHAAAMGEVTGPKRGVVEDVADVRSELNSTKEELETERMRLAGCGVAALGYFDGCCDEYKSSSLDDVLRLRQQLKAAQEEIITLQKLNGVTLVSELRDQLATAEQRVAEACAKVCMGPKGSDGNIFADDAAAYIRTGEWHKFLKEGE